MARRRRGRGAAAVIASNIARSKTKGNRKPSTNRRSSQTAGSRVGGWAGGNFDNANVGR